MNLSLIGIISSEVHEESGRIQFEISKEDWPVPIRCVSTGKFGGKNAPTIEIHDKVLLMGDWRGPVFHFDYAQKEVDRPAARCWAFAVFETWMDIPVLSDLAVRGGGFGLACTSTVDRSFEPCGTSPG
jgi:hypothetical protein